MIFRYRSVRSCHTALLLSVWFSSPACDGSPSDGVDGTPRSETGPADGGAEAAESGAGEDGSRESGAGEGGAPEGGAHEGGAVEGGAHDDGGNDGPWADADGSRASDGASSRDA